MDCPLLCNNTHFCYTCGTVNPTWMTSWRRENKNPPQPHTITTSKRSFVKNQNGFKSFHQLTFLKSVTIARSLLGYIPDIHAFIRNSFRNELLTNLCQTSGYCQHIIAFYVRLFGEDLIKKTYLCKDKNQFSTDTCSDWPYSGI